jgi:MSHA biogenesis protein MshQ
VPLYTQYYNNGGFVLNTADVCSVVPSTALDFGAGTPAGLPAAGVLSFPISTGTSTATLTGTAVAGQFGLLLSAPGSGKTGEINLQLNMGTAGLPWLQYDWNGDGSGNDDPTARATFGTFQGPKRVIFKREVW